MTDSASPSNSERAPKRRRVAVACRPCRERKSRCDGGRPRCALCSQHDSQCSYPPTMSKSDLIREEFSSVFTNIEARLSGFEKALSDFQSRLGSQNGAPSGFVSPSSENTNSTPTAVDGEITISEDAFITNNQSENSAADGIGTVPLTSREDFAFFGPSSNISLLRLVSKALASSTAPNQTSRNTRMDRTRTEADARLRDHEADSGPSAARMVFDRTKGLTFPPDRKARELFLAFFRYSGPVQPYIHEARFMDVYEEVYRSGFKVVRRSWLALAYTVFAVSALLWPYSCSFKARLVPESEAWFRMAADLILKQVFAKNGANIELVQTLMTMVVYLQSADNSAKTWLVHGLAVKLAYQLGLHSAEASKTADPIERESRKRTWYYLVLTDRVLSMAFGRPPEIRNVQYNLCLPEPYEDAVHSEQIIKEEISIHTLQASLGLYDIIYKAIDILYGQNTGVRPAFSLDIIAKVYSLENELLQWNAELGPQKILQAEEFTNSFVTSKDWLEFSRLRLRTVIALRYHNVRILVHRPIIEGLLEAIIHGDQDCDHWRMLRQAGSNSIGTVVSSAITTLSIIHNRISSLSQGQHLLGAWWFSLYFTFNAALALLGSLVVQRTKGDVLSKPNEAGDASAAQALQHALEILDGLDGGHSAVTHCRNYLQGLIRIADTCGVHTLRQHSEADEAHQHADIQTSQAEAVPSGDALNAALFPQLRSPKLSPLLQFASDLDLENFLFPLDIQMISGHGAGINAAIVP